MLKHNRFMQTEIQRAPHRTLTSPNNDQRAPRRRVESFNHATGFGHPARSNYYPHPSILIIRKIRHIDRGLRERAGCFTCLPFPRPQCLPPTNRGSRQAESLSSRAIGKTNATRATKAATWLEATTPTRPAYTRAPLVIIAIRLPCPSTSTPSPV